MSFDLEYWRGFQEKDFPYNIVKELTKDVYEKREDIRLRITSYITKIPYNTLKNNKVKLKNIKTGTTVQSQYTLDGKIECYIHNKEILAEMFIGIGGNPLRY